MEKEQTQNPENPLNEVWRTLRNLEINKIPETGRTLVELYIKEEVPLDEYGRACYWVGKRAGQAATWIRDELQRTDDPNGNNTLQGPKEYWLALHTELSSAGVAFTDRALKIQEKLEPEGKTILGSIPSEIVTS